VTVGDWLARRAPAPPPALRARLESALGAGLAREADDATEVMVGAAEALVEGLLRGDATSRESALDLLAADALVTYAFEAASASPSTLVASASRAMTRLAALASTGAPASAPR
jgi:hypothetical protein